MFPPSFLHLATDWLFKTDANPMPDSGLGMNNSDIINVIWHGIGSQPTETDFLKVEIYPMMIDNVWQSLTVVSVGAITGCLITFVAIDMLGRRNIQLIGFFFLFILFIIIGSSVDRLYDIGGSAATIVLYILCQIFFNFGKLPLTRCWKQANKTIRSKYYNIHSQY
jgi:PHS family inorganic phosphate transporter-like MFS transporter